MYNQRNLFTIQKPALLFLVVISFLCASTIGAQTKSKSKVKSSETAATIDSALLGVWGVDERGGYEFKKDGTSIMEGSITYNFDASNGVWHYWQPSMPGAKVTADYKVSPDGKSLSINLKKGKPFTSLKKIK